MNANRVVKEIRQINRTDGIAEIQYKMLIENEEKI